MDTHLVATTFSSREQTLPLSAASQETQVYKVTNSYYRQNEKKKQK